MQAKSAYSRGYCIFLGVSMFCASASGGLIGKLPITRKTESPNGSFVFVVVSPGSFEHECAALDDELWELSATELIEIKEQIRQIRSQFRRTGMYRNDGSTSPIWTTQEALTFVHVADDGKHLVVEEAWVWGDGHGGKVARFIREGVVVKEHHVVELIPLYFVRQLILGSGPECARAVFDPSSATYTVKSDQCDTIVFDAVRGDVLNSNASEITLQIIVANRLFQLMFGLVAACLTLTCVHLIGCRRKKAIT